MCECLMQLIAFQKNFKNINKKKFAWHGIQNVGMVGKQKVPMSYDVFNYFNILISIHLPMDT
jgi:hypothetical protein